MKFITTLSLLISVAAISLVLFRPQKKIAFVRTGVLIESFTGTHELGESMQKQLDPFEAELDRINNLMEQAEESGNRGSIDSLNYVARHVREEMAVVINKQEAGLSAGVLNQMNTLVQQFGDENDYQVILGTTDDGGVLYGSELLDITELVIADINKKYEGIQ